MIHYLKCIPPRWIFFFIHLFKNIASDANNGEKEGFFFMGEMVMMYLVWFRKIGQMELFWSKQSIWKVWKNNKRSNVLEI